MTATEDQRQRAWQLSAGLRFDRAMTRAHVGRGVSLALLISERRYELEGVRLGTLVRWVPFVGATKANRILLDLPHHYQLRDISENDRALLTLRLANAERQLLRRSIYQEA